MRRRTSLSRWRDADRRLVRWIVAPATGSSLTWDNQSAGYLAIVVVSGDLDADTAPRLARRIVPLADAGRRLILDLAAVRFCDCAGLNLFLRLQQRARAAGGSLHLAAPTAPVRRLITLTCVGAVLPIADSPADAVAALGGIAITGPSLVRPDARQPEETS